MSKEKKREYRRKRKTLSVRDEDRIKEGIISLNDERKMGIGL